MIQEPSSVWQLSIATKTPEKPACDEIEARAINAYASRRILFFPPYPGGIEGGFVWFIGVFDVLVRQSEIWRAALA